MNRHSTPLSALVPEVCDEAVSSGELGTPVPVIADLPRPTLVDGLSNDPKRGVRDHGGPMSVHANHLVAAHRDDARYLSVPRAVGLAETDRGGLHAGDLADERSQASEVTSGAPGENRAQRLGLLGCGPVIGVHGHLP